MLNHLDEYQNSDEIKFQIKSKDDGASLTHWEKVKPKPNKQKQKLDVTKTSNVPGRLLLLASILYWDHHDDNLLPVYPKKVIVISNDCFGEEKGDYS